MRVYEKLANGIWTYNGPFKLVGATMQHDGLRKVCVLELVVIEVVEDERQFEPASPGRLIPTEVKIAVMKRDRGKCVECGSETDLHFDHTLPFSRGGSSTNLENIQLLCQRHNLEKSNRII